ncbi:MAG: cysteine desulfurase [Lachnospiraceae bacterium]|nr:cysteine desulfurase [Lachnospiraceae bacterium]
MYCYFDNSATTKCAPQVIDKMNDVMKEHYGNPSSLHNMGFDGEKMLSEARSIIAKALKANDKEIIFTSGGTESNNMALIGGAMANKRAGMHIITSSIEHASVNEPLKFLEEQGFEITHLPCDNNGVVSIAELEKQLRDDTIMVSIMHVNNEIGAVQPVEDIGRIIKKYNSKCLFHVDAIQSFGKYAINPKKLHIDLLSVSGHKIHGPKGSGFLYIKQGTKIRPIIYGGGQEMNLRSGTENVYSQSGLGTAVSLMVDNMSDNVDTLRALKKRLVERVSKMEFASINGKTGDDSAPNIVSVSVKDVRAEVVLHSLEEKEIYVSAGSACSSNKPALSRTLQSIGLPKELLDKTIRFSFSIYNTIEEVDYACDVLEEIVPVLGKYVRR